MCKSGASEYIDTLFIYTDVSGTEPHQVILDFTDFTVSVEEEQRIQPASIDVYPSPAANAADVAVRFEEPATAVIRAFDILGREVPIRLEESGIGRQHRFRIDVKGWAPGLYMLRIEGVVGGRVLHATTRPMVVVR